LSTRDPPEAKAIGLSCLAPLGTPIGHGLLVVPYFSYSAFGPDGDGTFALQSWADAFVDPALPACYGPLGIQAIGGRLFMTLAKQNPPSHDEMAGEGLGVVDEFIMNGDFVARVATHGLLNAPWGVAMAPAGFGRSLAPPHALAEPCRQPVAAALAILARGRTPRGPFLRFAVEAAHCDG